jgi:hypothetical protein
MQTNVFGPLATFGSWISGRSIPSNVYASASWSWLKNSPEKDATKSS